MACGKGSSGDAAPDGAAYCPVTSGKCLCGLPMRPAAQPAYCQRCEDAVASRRIRCAKDKRHPGGFVALPYAVIRSEQWARLSSKAVKFLLDLLAQYRGDNNGDFCAAWTVMSKRGWRSRDTLAKALKELVANGWIVQTRQGGMHFASLYAVTFIGFDPMSKLDMSLKAFPRGAWCRTAPAAAGQKRDLEPAGRVDLEPFDTDGVSMGPSSSLNQHVGSVVEGVLHE
jgi:hypothetical protein